MKTTRRTLLDTKSRNLLVISGTAVSTHPLPESGSITIGRDAGCDVVLDHDSVSRKHARLTIGPPLEVEDLKSANGTRVRDTAIKAPTRVDPGEVIEIGSVMVIVQDPSTLRRPHRIWSHGYFEIRLEEEAARARREGKPFVLARIHCSKPVPPSIIEEHLASVLKPEDVLGEYGPAEYEIVFIGASEVTSIHVSLDTALARLGVPVRIGLAAYPRDATNPHQLFAIACAAVRGKEEIADPKEPVVASRAMEDVYRLVRRIAPGNLPVLILGETGVGKELVARAVHDTGARARKPFVALNCAAIPDALLESELFGHERGAFTSATVAKPGLIETADGGTVFLDEIGELPAAAQAKLLRVLENREVMRVGGQKARTIDVRFVGATHRDLEASAAAGSFRLDLFHRLDGVRVVVPPLRSRQEEILPLAKRFLERAAKENKQKVAKLSDEAIALLQKYEWPGNVRELKNMMERAALLSDGIITYEHLPVDRLTGRTTSAPVQSAPSTTERRDLDGDMNNVRRAHVLEALAACAGNQTLAAEKLGITRRTLSTWLDELSIPRPRKGR